MIDTQLRSQLAQQRQQNEFMKGMKDAIVTGLKTKADNGEASDILKLVFKKEEDQQLSSTLQKIGQALVKIYASIPKQTVLPKLFQVQGKVEVTKQPPVVVANLSDLGKYFQSLEQRLTVWAQAASTARPPEITIPKFDIPKNDPIDLSEITTAIRDLEKALQGQEKSSDTAILRRMADTLSEFTSRPTMTTPAATHISLNPLQGIIKTTDNTIGTTLTKLPSYGQLFNRRSIQLYNNSANTVYIGGSDVTVNNGIPVPASSFSTILDIGYNIS